MFEELPAHVRLMLLAARTRPTAAEQAELRATAAEPVDWQEFLAVVKTHKLVPTVYEAVRSVVPEFVVTALAAKRKLNDQRVVRCAIEMKRLTERFREAGVGLTPLKGLVLAQVFYGDAQARHVGDLDVLTDSGDLVGQIELLRKMGYVVENPKVRLTPRRLSSYRRFWKDLTFRHVETGRLLDVHWRLFNNSRHAGNGLVAPVRQGQVAVLGLEMQGMVPVDQFCYAALHGVSDEWVYLKALADVAAYLRGAPGEQVEEALVRARALGILPQVSSAIHLAREWMGVRCEHALLLPPTDALHVRLRARMMTRLRANDFRPMRNRLGALDQAKLELQLAPGWRSAAEMGLRYAFRPRVWGLVDLPDAWFWVYPVLGVLTPPRLAPD